MNVSLASWVAKLLMGVTSRKKLKTWEMFFVWSEAWSKRSLETLDQWLIRLCNYAAVSVMACWWMARATHNVGWHRHLFDIHYQVPGRRYRKKISEVTRSSIGSKRRKYIKGLPPLAPIPLLPQYTPLLKYFRFQKGSCSFQECYHCVGRWVICAIWYVYQNS